MGGGPKALLNKLDTAFEEKKYKWSLKLCDALLNINAEKSKATVKLFNFCIPYHNTVTFSENIRRLHL